jgi:hypothetical protein
MRCEMCDHDPEMQFIAHHRVLVGCVPSQNQLKGNTRFNHQYRKWRKLFEHQVEQWALPTVAGKNEYRVGLITRHYGLNADGAMTRAYDLENFIGGLKPFIDALKNKGIIWDDGEKYWRGYYFQVPAHDRVSRLTFELRIQSRR